MSLQVSTCWIILTKNKCLYQCRTFCFHSINKGQYRYQRVGLFLRKTNVCTGTYWYLLVYSYFKEVSVPISNCWFILTVKKRPYRYLPVKLFLLETNFRTDTVPVVLFCISLHEIRDHNLSLYSYILTRSKNDFYLDLYSGTSTLRTFKSVF